MTTNEPVALTAAIGALLISIMDFIVLIGVWTPTADALAGAHLIIGNAVIVAGALIARGKVTPTDGGHP